MQTGETMTEAGTSVAPYVPVNSCIESLSVKRSLAEHPKRKIEKSNVVLCRHCFLTTMMVLDDG